MNSESIKVGPISRSGKVRVGERSPRYPRFPPFLNANYSMTEHQKPFYCCDVGTCSKRFKRSDHLLRHKRNHDTSTSFSCTWPGCYKTFVRKDVQMKHIKRHVEKESTLAKPVRFLEVFTPDLVQGRAKRSSHSDSSTEESRTSDQANREHQPITVDTNSVISTSTQTDYLSEFGKSSIDYVMNELASPLQTDEMSDLIGWLLNDDPENSYKYLDYSPSSSFKDMLSGTPNFMFSTSQSSVDSGTIEKMLQLMPILLTSTCFSGDTIERFLDSYWSVFHIQFPVIHRPTFSPAKANPLLLLSMISVGASVCSRTCKDKRLKDEFVRLADTIAQPLRWLICSHSEDFTTISSWCIQSLLILECYETTCGSRKLHQRAHLHHGFKIEVLRRGPLLGGDPGRASGSDSDLSTGVWDNWVEIESLKRCAYVAFLVGTIHSVIFGHDTILFTHHIKLAMPSPEPTWETISVEKEGTFMKFDNEKFLSLITNLLRRKTVSTSPFTTRLLLVGIIGLVLQTDQNEMQMCALQGQTPKSWKSDLINTLDFWYDTVIDQGCCLSDTAYYIPLDVLSHSMYSPEDTTCKFPVYHIAHSFLRLSQYDCIIYAGAPNRMNVKTDTKDYARVSQRVKSWANSSSGAMLVAHAYTLLCEVLLSQDEFGNDVPITYDPNTDPIFYRANLVASAVFLVWDYNYCLDGPESQYLEDSEFILSSKYIPEKLNGHRYLQKIQKAFRDNLGLVSGSRKFTVYSASVSGILNKHHMVGLLRLLKDRYNSCNSQICREYGRLMENCIQRSLGRKTVMCNNMYQE